MDLLTLKQFAVLLWKNFTLKRRQFFSLIFEVLTALVFPVMLLLFRAIIKLPVNGPYNFTSQPISTLPPFLQNPREWKLIYVPSKIDVVKEITENVKRNLNIDIKVQGFSSESEFEEYVKYDYGSYKVLAAIVFDCDFKNSGDPLPLQVKYHLRFIRIQRTILWPDTIGWKTSFLFPNHPFPGPRNPDHNDGGSPGYIREGFLAVQHALDKAIMLYHESNARQKLFDGISIFVQRFPYPAYPHDGLLWLTGSYLPLIFILMFSPTVLSIVRSIVWEKENRLKIIREPLFRYSDYSFIFFFLTCYAIASIFFAFMISTFFSKGPLPQRRGLLKQVGLLHLKEVQCFAFVSIGPQPHLFPCHGCSGSSAALWHARLAASAGSLIYFASFFPFNSVAQNFGEITLTRKVASCLSSNVALALGIKLLVTLEIKRIGVKWNNLWTPASLDDNLVLGHMSGMLLLDAFLYGLATWYIENVFPGKYGVPKPWYFFLMRSYWFGQPRIKRKKRKVKDGEVTQNKYFEPEPTSLVAGIQIKNLYKEFGDKVAINNMSLNLYEGQITIFLGQNGAGKSTTLSILTGRYPPTRGEVYVDGYDITKNITKIRESLGFCPQHDLLFNDLTLSEHLFFYSVVKSVSHKVSPVEIDHMLSTFNLLEKRDAFSQSLSGGMKRKLSIIIALSGGSKVVILDEPSSGMDPVSRRATWDLLQQFKHNRTILLTTHYMDEADVLGDRIAIMINGTLRCCGSSIFLKQIYGAGYHIVMEREPHCDVDEVSAMIQSHIPGAVLENCFGAELSFILPKEHTHRFEALFNDLETNQKELGIANFGASITTMEEVFLKVNRLADSQMNVRPTQSTPLKSKKIRQDMKQNKNVSRNCNRPVFSRLNEIANIKFNTGFLLYCQQFHSMFMKRALFTWRNWKLSLLQMSVILFVTTYLFSSLNLDSEPPAREMDLSQYGRTIVPYSISGNSDLALNIVKNLEIFLKLKNQELRKVQGNVKNYILENKECHDFSIIAFSIEVVKNKTVFTLLFNNEAYHSAATSLAVLDNSLFTSLSGPNASIKASNKPQPLSLYGTNELPTSGLEIVLCLAFGMALVAGSFCLQTVTERTNKAKHIQFVSGVYLLTYWLSALLWDLIYFFVTCCLLLGVFVYCGVDALVADYHFLDTMMIFMLYGWSVVPLMYLGSLLFSSSAAAYIKLTLFNYFSAVFSIIIHAIIQYYRKDIPQSTRTSIGNALMMLPGNNFVVSISRFFDDYQVKKLCAKQLKNIYLDCGKKFVKNKIYSFGERGITKFLISLAAQGLIYLLLLLCLESTFWNLKNFVYHKIIFNVYKKFMKGTKATVSTQVTKEYEDKDVEDERKRVLTLLTNLKRAPLLLNELTKIYYKCPVVKAVRNISLLVQKYECFGLLGLNGAGKTTTFKMLTGEETTTSGLVLIDGISITENIRKIRSRIGYCPQSDPMLNHMTGRELLIMYARLRGVPEPDIYMYVETFLHSMHLETHADKYIYTYSGGNKRKLNTAIALMGKSSVVFLDEPSTGMDPVARRLLWDTVTWMCKTGKAIIITSHSMEECEALCTRLAIMVKGQFKCLGSPQHLRNKFGNVYILTAKIKIDENEDKLAEFKEFIATTFPGSVLKQENQRILNYYIPSKDNTWGKVFGILEEAKEQFNLEDYSISQITLEQVFLSFANLQYTEDDYQQKVP
uniref:Phospholipid-transporting ATPase ABCA3-like isoform X1 n=1 Tax=Camelus bactrianus TaxID=9837 RepID=A0A9W3GDV9_CAMBA|nr:phospholipid-transporting ATPase ABCA3-like isoform X1 [Camelus bactrianus]XP_045377107.1 phospholipid-transporting ATPase ABCA3-like isoform X1 [Camelus bactrianus]